MSSHVAPVWVRGLKQDLLHGVVPEKGRTRMGAWIETITLGVKLIDQVSHPYGCVD